MKVLIINSVCGIRSTGRICTDFALELEKCGHEVRIAYGRESVPEQFQKFAVRIGNNKDVILHGIKARLIDGDGRGSRQATLKFIRWVEAYNPHVIHLHNIHGYYINTEMLFRYLAKCGKKIIWTLHDCWAFTGHSGTCDFVHCEKWKTGCYDCPQTGGYPKSLMDCSRKNWMRKMQLITAVPEMQIVTPSYWLTGLAIQSYLSKFNIQTIHNGIDVNQFYPINSDFREINGIEDKFIILGVANVWSKGKGFDDFLKLSPLLREKFLIILVGLTDKQIKAIPYNIIGLKRTNSVKQLAEIYSMADVFFNPTYCDTYPTVNLEAISCGTPVITYQTGGSPESVSEECGYVVKQGDLHSVLEKIEDYRNNPGKFSRIRSTNDFDKVSVMDKYLNMYKMKQ